MNKYLETFEEHDLGKWDFSCSLERYRMRHDLVRRYAWAVPSQAALDLVAAHGPIVEIGAGTGYWAHLLRTMGVDVVAYDIAPPTVANDKNTHHEKTSTWTKVLRGGARKAAQHPDRTLFLCWPPYNSRMAWSALGAYKGNTVIYVGEGEGGCTGCHKFHRRLASQWRKVAELRLPQYEGIHDYLTVYKR